MRALILVLLLTGCESADHKLAVERCGMVWDRVQEVPILAAGGRKLFLSECTWRAEGLIPKCRGIKASIPGYCADAMGTITGEIYQDLQDGKRPLRP